MYVAGGFPTSRGALGVERWSPRGRSPTSDISLTSLISEVREDEGEGSNGPPMACPPADEQARISILGTAASGDPT